jgi:hypothetical protein
MNTYDQGVVVAQWKREVSRDAAGDLIEGLDRFAGANGMSVGRRRHLGVALKEALGHTLMRPSAPGRGQLEVDAASDGQWLCVRVGVPGEQRPGAAFPRALRLADRTELPTADHPSLVMDFALTGRRSTGPLCSGALGRRSAPREWQHRRREGRRHL